MKRWIMKVTPTSGTTLSLHPTCQKHITGCVGEGLDGKKEANNKVSGTDFAIKKIRFTLINTYTTLSFNL